MVALGEGKNNATVVCETVEVSMTLGALYRPIFEPNFIFRSFVSYRILYIYS